MVQYVLSTLLCQNKWNVSSHRGGCCIPVGRYHVHNLLVYDVDTKKCFNWPPTNIPAWTIWCTKIIDIKALPSYINNECELCFCKAMVGSVCQKKKRGKKKTFKCNQVFVCYKECTSISHKKSLDKCYYKMSFLWSCIKAPQLNVGKSWKRLFFLFLKKNKNTITPFFVMHINSNTLL